MKISLPITFILIPAIITSAAFASSGSHGDPHEIPWNTIKWQTVNLVLLFGTLTYFLRKTVRAHFQSRRTTYLDLVSKAELAHQQAEANRLEMQSKLANLEKAAKTNINQAQAEAEELKKRFQDEAHALTERLKTEAERTVKIEVERAKEALRAELSSKAIELARERLQREVSGQEQERLQSEFVSKIQVVQ